jgi:beta-phosphoglucomutase-like phosphatase (HAD superfamily)
VTAPRFDAILFDFDGVLADTEPLHFECWQTILTPHGIRLDWETYNSVGRGVTDHEMIRSFCRLADPPASFDRVWSDYPAKVALFRQTTALRQVITEQVCELLAELHAGGYRLGVVSSSARAEVAAALDAAKLRPLLGALVCREDVPRHKPHPDPYRRGAALLQARRPLVVEDSDPGEASGVAAGFEVLRVDRCEAMPDLLRSCLFPR